MNQPYTFTGNFSFLLLSISLKVAKMIGSPGQIGAIKIGAPVALSIALAPSLAGAREPAHLQRSRFPR